MAGYFGGIKKISFKQTDQLKEIFKVERYPSQPRKIEIAEALELTNRQVVNYFLSLRRNEKRRNDSAKLKLKNAQTVKKVQKKKAKKLRKAYPKFNLSNPNTWFLNEEDQVQPPDHNCPILAEVDEIIINLPMKDFEEEIKAIIIRNPLSDIFGYLKEIYPSIWDFIKRSPTFFWK